MSAIAPRTFVVDQIRCPECSMTCLQKNIYRHMCTVHTWSRDDCKVLINAIRSEKKGRETKSSFICSYCDIMFRSVRHLVQHKRICEQPRQIEEVEEELEEEVVEEYLEEMIVEQEEEVVDYLEMDEKPSTSVAFEPVIPPHRQSSRPIPTHHLSPEKLPPVTKNEIPEDKLKFPTIVGRHRGTETKCPECPTTVESIEHLLSHCREKHESPDRKFYQERQLFNTKEDFKKWFDQRQEDTCTSLTKRTGHGGETFYRCHRVGKYQSVATARKSNPRKIDQTCTAYLKVFTQEDGLTWANGCFTHIGHELDHKLLWLTETQENYVRELIDLGWSSDQIFFYIRDEYRNYECKLKYISKNDIRNITVRYNREKQKLQVSKNLPVSDGILFPRQVEKRLVEQPETLKNEKVVKAELAEKNEEPVLKAPRTSGPSENSKTSEEVVLEEDNEYINVVDDEPSANRDTLSA